MQQFQFALDNLIAAANYRPYRPHEKLEPLHLPIRFFHYTRPESAWSIIRTDCLKLSEVRRMNDASEIDFFLSTVGAALGIKSPHAKPLLMKRLPSIEQMIHGEDISDIKLADAAIIFDNAPQTYASFPTIEAAVRRAINWRETHSLHVLSFSQSNRDYWCSTETDLRRVPILGVALESDLGIADDLALWRGYADGGAGIAIELGRGDLGLRHAYFFDAWHVELFLSLLRKCSGSARVNAALREDLLHDMGQSLQDADRQYHELYSVLAGAAAPPQLLDRDAILLRCRYETAEDILSSLELLLHDVDSALQCSFAEQSIPPAAEDALVRFFLALAALYKHPGFESESEWRLLNIAPRASEPSPLAKERGLAASRAEMAFGRTCDQLSNARDPWVIDTLPTRRPLSVVLGPAIDLDIIPADIMELQAEGVLRFSRSKIPFLR